MWRGRAKFNAFIIEGVWHCYLYLHYQLTDPQEWGHMSITDPQIFAHLLHHFDNNEHGGTPLYSFFGIGRWPVFLHKGGGGYNFKAERVSILWHLHGLRQRNIQPDLWYKTHQIPKLICFSFRFAVIFVQSIEARYYVDNEDWVGAAPTDANVVDLIAY